MADDHAAVTGNEENTCEYHVIQVANGGFDTVDDTKAVGEKETRVYKSHRELVSPEAATRDSDSNNKGEDRARP